MTLGSIGRAGAVGVLLLALAGCAVSSRRALDPADRTPAGGRDAVVSVVQERVQANAMQAPAATAQFSAGHSFASGALAGAIGAMAQQLVAESQHNETLDFVMPLLDALSDYDFDGKALQASSDGLARLPWLDVRKVSFSKDASDTAVGQALQQSQAAETLFINYSYAFADRFASLQVSAVVAIIAKRGSAAHPHADAVFLQRFTYLATLPSHSRDYKRNTLDWANDHGRLARAAVDQGLLQLNAMIQRSLEQTPEQADQMRHGDIVNVGDRGGRLVEKSEAGMLLIDPYDTWLYVSAPPQ